MKRVAILGSTGSIGTQTLQILSEHPHEYRVFALSAYRNVEKMVQQCQAFLPSIVVMVDEAAASQLRDVLKQASLTQIEVKSGLRALEEVVSLAEVDVVMAAIVGAAGLRSTLAAVNAAKRVLLANKESLVMAGELFMRRVFESGAELLPVDSEHNALFQCMPTGYQIGQTPKGVSQLILTASGGPFLETPLSELAHVTPAQAVAHPNWSMGAKISVDSATMVNKALELIEAHWLFAMPAQQLQVMIHPQSIIHSLVCYEDGSILSQMGAPDMRIPIASALSWPARLTTSAPKLDLASMASLVFRQPDMTRFRSLSLVFDVMASGGMASCIFNAANEVAVAAFLREALAFDQIVNVIDHVLQKMPIESTTDLESILYFDQKARKNAENVISAIAA